MKSAVRINNKAIWVTDAEAVGKMFPFFAFIKGYPLPSGTVSSAIIKHPSHKNIATGTRRNLIRFMAI